MSRSLKILTVAATAALAVTQPGCGASDTSASRSATAGPPRYAATVELRPVSGRVFVRAPGSNRNNSAAGRQKAFARLTHARLVPTHTRVDTTGGSVTLITATPNSKQLQTGQFHGGIFEIRQNHGDRGLADLLIIDNRTRRHTCGPTTAGRVSTRILGLLRGSANGRFRTTGDFAAASVRGTEWGVRDRCDGTLVVVERGTVLVTDFRRGRKITLRARHTYLAKAG